jgi:hypothetical protein
VLQGSPDFYRAFFCGREISLGGNMTKGWTFAFLVLTLATACSAQEGLTVHRNGKQKMPTAEAEKVYLSACSAVQREFGANRSVRPRVTLVLGADKNIALPDQREIRLTKWDRFLFAQGIVLFAFDELMTANQRMTLAKRAVSWADATVEIERESK